MHMVGGLVGVCVLYPAIGLMTYALTPYSPLAVVSLVAASGYAAVLRQPVPDMLRELRASIRMHARQRMSSEGVPHAASDQPEWLVGLSAQRTALQQGLRDEIVFFRQGRCEDEGILVHGRWWPARETGRGHACVVVTLVVVTVVVADDWV